MHADKHLLQYIFLIVGLLAIFIPFIFLAHSYAFQVATAGAGSILFIGWGILHHIREGRVRKSVIGEYVLLGVVIFFIIFTVLSLF